MILTDEIKHLFEVVRVKLGAPIRPIQLDDNQMCALLESVIGDYSEKIQNWTIQQNWLTMMGKRFGVQSDPQTFMQQVTMRQLDFTKDYSYWFSKEVGLQQRGHFELKKDFFTIEKGKQVYLIPAGREINNVMYVTPPTTKTAIYGINGGMLDQGLGMGYGQMGGANSIMQGFYIGASFDSALYSAHLKYQNSMLRGDLTFKVTALSTGEHLVHLMSVPGSPNSFGGLALDDAMWSKHYGCHVWYTYYDTFGMNNDEVMQCKLENKDDIVLDPSSVPMSKMQYEFFNEPAKNTIRQLLFAECAMTLAMIRGYASGKVQIPNAEMQLDYAMFMDIGKQEKEKAYEDLKNRLEQMLPWNLAKNYADMVEENQRILRNKAFIKPIMMI